MQRRFDAIKHMTTACAVVIAGFTAVIRSDPVATVAAFRRRTGVGLLSAGVGRGTDTTNDTIASALRRFS